MTAFLVRNQRVYALQNGIAASIFAALLAAELIRHLLGLYPASELLWRLTSIANWTVGPLLSALDPFLSAPAALAAALLAGLILPLAAWRRRNWLGTAISGHVALGCLVALAFFALRRNNTGTAMASLSNVFEPRLYDANATGFVILALVMAGFCLLNHLAFFRLKNG